jgi:hypothetical protein
VKDASCVPRVFGCGTRIAWDPVVGWQMTSHRPLFALVTPDGGRALLKDDSGRCLMLVFTTAAGAESLARALGLRGMAHLLPADIVALIAETRQVGAVGVVVDYDPARADGPVTEQWVPDLSA